MSRLGLAVVACCTLALGALAGPVAAAKAPAKGKWRGELTPGKKINFKVKGGKVRKLAAGVKSQCVDRATNEPTRKITISVTPDEPIEIASGRFSFRVFDSFTGVSSDGEGEFVRRKRAKGTMDAVVRLDPTNEECVGSASWTAKRKKRR